MHSKLVLLVSFRLFDKVFIIIFYVKIHMVRVDGLVQTFHFNLNKLF